MPRLPLDVFYAFLAVVWWHDVTTVATIMTMGGNGRNFDVDSAYDPGDVVLMVAMATTRAWRLA